MDSTRWCHVCSGSGIDRHGDDCLCRFVGEYERQELPNPETLPDVTYIPIAPDDLSELQRKATAYNELKSVIDRLDCEIQDLKKLFV